MFNSCSAWRMAFGEMWITRSKPCSNSRTSDSIGDHSGAIAMPEEGNVMGFWRSKRDLESIVRR